MNEVRGLLAGAGFGLALTGAAVAQETIKVGVLHPLSGTMAISETTLKEPVLMMSAAQKRQGRRARQTA